MILKTRWNGAGEGIPAGRSSVDCAMRWVARR